LPVSQNIREVDLEFGAAPQRFGWAQHRLRWVRRCVAARQAP
jgi:hypothetical protein